MIMAPTSEKVSMCRQETDKTMDAGLPARESIVISGMSGLYPNSRNVQELAHILYNKIDPVTSDHSRWVFNHVEMTNYLGMVPELSYFDAQFFKVHYYLAKNMDVISRKILEQAHMAIYDAGINPEQLNGKKVGVFIGSSMSENEKVAIYVTGYNARAGFDLLGCSKTMFANRISYWLNAKGPSLTVDQACCSSTLALELAYQAMQRGDCESAIVGGCNLCLHPQSLIHYGRFLKLSKDGKTKSFDENADGSAKSEAINVLFLQKAKDALRIYAELVNVKSEFTSVIEDETGPRFGLYRNPITVTKFLKQFYEESNVAPQAVDYIEGCGSAIPEVDKGELEVYEQTFCHDRSNPLLIGSIMSNIGNVETASGIAGITKILLGYHTGVLAGNLHCASPRSDVAALRDGRMVIVNDHVPFGHGYTAVNGFSVTGVNSHLLLKGHYKPKDLNRYKSKIPHLVFISGRQDTAVVKILKHLKSRPIDPEEIALLNNAHSFRINGHLDRGFILLDTNQENKTVSLSEKVQYLDYVKRPLWFVYSGMGSQYNGMGTDLMRIPVFAAAIERCQRALQPKGIDIVHIITSSDKTIFNNILNSFVGIAAIQIGLTDVLRELGIVPDKIIGHSLGEFGCAYADECFTAEEMILSAYSRGFISVQTPFIEGSMAAVGLGYKQILSMCPPEIEVACHNSSESCTISGPAEIMREFVAKLVSNNIFAKEVPCSNIAYHSRYIASAGPDLLKYLSEIIKSPKARSDRWLSTSVPRDKWNSPSAKYSSAEYHTNNLLNPVLFEETCRLIPPNAILVEIAPHGLLQSILKRSLPASCTNVQLTHRGCQDNAAFLLEAIGKLYLQGLNPKIQSLYPKIEFPVSTVTPMLSHLVEWVHSERWPIPLYSNISTSKKYVAATNYIISLDDKEHTYLKGHVIEGKNLYPFAATLVAVWDTLAMSLGVTKRRLPVQFHEVILHVQPIMHDRRHLRLKVSLQCGTRGFEVTDDFGLVASGFIHAEKYCNTMLHDVTESHSLNITSREIYDHFYFSGFSYKDSFKSIHSTNLALTEARIQWCGNWVTFIDGMFQLNNLRHSYDSFSQPDFIVKLSIDPDEQHKYEDTLKTATVLEIYNSTKCGGVVMENVKFRDLPKPIENSPVLRKLKHVPHFPLVQFDFETILQVYLQIVAENVGSRPINVLGIYNDQNTFFKFNEIKHIIEVVSEITTVCRWLTKDSILNEQNNNFSEVKLIIVCNLASDNYMCQTLDKLIVQDKFILNIRTNSSINITRPSALYQVISNHNIDSSNALELVRWRSTNTSRNVLTSVISVNSPSDFPLLLHESKSLLPNQNLLVVTTYPAVPGLKNILNELKNRSRCNIRLVMNENDDKETMDDAIMNTDLAVKVIRNGVLGGEYYVPLDSIGNIKGNVMLQSSLVSQIKSLKWVQTSSQQNPGVLVKVHYAALNDIDAKRFNRLIPVDDTICRGYGMDFSGTTQSGARVMGLVYCGAVSTLIQANPDLLWPVPEYWSLEDAATVPFAYCLAYYCLFFKCKFYPGLRVLVHGGTGGLGQAIISLALANHCEVFATVSDIRKKQLLLTMYPDLKAENIGNSRDLTFCDLVLNATNGVGADIVISTVSGEPKKVSLNCVTHLGVMIDVTQIPSRENYDYGMYQMTKSRSYVTIDFLSIFNEKGNTMKKLQRMVSDGIVSGWVRPLSRVIYTPEVVSRAFRLLTGSNQRGRVLLNLQQIDTDFLCIHPWLQCSPTKRHIIISDHEDFGQQLADMLVNRGVQNIHLSLPISAEYYKLKIRNWQKQGVQVSSECATKLDVPGFYADDCTVSSEDVEGIYIIITSNHRSDLETNAFVETIDIRTRKTFPDLLYFAVINTVNSIGEETCMSRNKDKLAATMLRLPEIKAIGDTDIQGRVSVREAVDTVERAIISQELILSARIVSTPPSSLLHQVAEVAELNIPQDIEGITTLSDLGINRTKADIVAVYLRNTYNIFFTVEEIQALTAERIQYIDENVTRRNYDNEKGLNKLFTCVETDEVIATTEMIFMPTLTSSATWRDNEFDVSLPYLCIIPGLEGCYGRFRTLCERLKLPALVLQPELDRPHETIPEMARRYAKLLTQTARPGKHFYLLGYETGVFVVLEMAAILEENGFTTLVYCIGNPDEIHTEIKEHLKGLETEEALKDAIVRHMFVMMTNNVTDELELALQEVSSWEEKLNVTVRTLLGKVSHSAQYARQLIVAAYRRIVSLLQYKANIKNLRSQLILMQPTSTAATALQQTTLQRYSQLPVVCHELQSPLAQAAEDIRCAIIVNAHLDDNILEEFEKKNLCQSYVQDKIDAIMSWRIIDQ